MELELRFFATYREATGRKTVWWEADNDDTVGDVLAALEDEYEGLAGSLLENGGLARQISVLKNGRGIIHLEGVGTELDDGDTLSIVPPVAGGRD